MPRVKPKSASRPTPVPRRPRRAARTTWKQIQRQNQASSELGLPVPAASQQPYLPLPVTISSSDQNNQRRSREHVFPQFQPQARMKNLSNNATFVTALFDIGRGSWDHYRRHFTEYLSYFKKVLALDVPLVVFIEKDTKDFVSNHRKGLEDITKITVKKFTDLEFYSYHGEIKHIMKTSTFLDGNEMTNHPEAFSPYYIIAVNNKTSFMKSVVEENPFQTSHFFWIDAGYGHGTDIFPTDTNWKPQNLLKLKKQVTFISLNDPENYRKLCNERKAHKISTDPAVIGGFFGGDAKAILEFYHLYRKVFRSALLNDVVDDDQGITLLCYFELPRLFNFVRGDWYDAFTLFK